MTQDTKILHGEADRISVEGSVKAGTLYGVGLGPGDPDLMTVKAARLISNARAIAYFRKKGGRGTARTIADGLISPDTVEIPLDYPMTTEFPANSDAYKTALHDFYETIAHDIRRRLDGKENVVVLCEGDPFFYGSFMHLYLRIRQSHKVEVVPGVSGMSGCWTQSGEPITYGDDILTVLPATLDANALAARIAATDACVFMKLGRHLKKVRAVLRDAGLLDRAIYVERGTMPNQIVLPLNEKIDDDAPYFSIVLVPGQGRRL